MDLEPSSCMYIVAKGPVNKSVWVRRVSSHAYIESCSGRYVSLFLFEFEVEVKLQRKRRIGYDHLLPTFQSQLN